MIPYGQGLRPWPYGEDYFHTALLLETLRERFVHVREHRDLSLRAAARQIGCAASTLNRMESGHEISVANAIRILRWLDRQ
jgi:plasmid maintenance system antidote protein VapI